MRRPVLKYFVLTYVIFLILFCLTGASFALNLPAIVPTIIQVVCAWSPTFAFLMMRKRLVPGVRLGEFIRRQFSTRLNLRQCLALLGIEALVFIGMVAGISIVDKLPLAVIINTSASAVVVGFFSQVIRGPLGEELGWRGYAQNELEKKHSPLTSALIVGVVWGFWHTPLWLVTSGYTGGKLLAYCGLFLIGLVSISVIMAYFYGKTKNLVIPMVIHQLLNFLGFLVVTDGFEVMLYMSSLYLIAALVLIVANRRTAFVLNQTAGVAAPSASAQM